MRAIDDGAPLRTAFYARRRRSMRGEGDGEFKLKRGGEGEVICSINFWGEGKKQGFGFFSFSVSPSSYYSPCTYLLQVRPRGEKKAKPPKRTTTLDSIEARFLNFCPVLTKPEPKGGRRRRRRRRAPSGTITLPWLYVVEWTRHGRGEKVAGKLIYYILKAWTHMFCGSRLYLKHGMHSWARTPRILRARAGGGTT